MPGKKVEMKDGSESKSSVDNPIEIDDDDDNGVDGKKIGSTNCSPMNVDECIVENGSTNCSPMYVDESEGPNEPPSTTMDLEKPSFRVTRTNNGRSQGRISQQQLVPRVSAAEKFSAGEETLRRLIDETEYEVGHDSYRGMRRYTSQSWSEDVRPSPWELSCSPHMNFKDEAHEKTLPEKMVLWASHTNCPTLLEWTENEIQQSKRKKGRKRKSTSFFQKPREDASIGKRPADVDFRCRCDYNPFCLATLGGAMNDILLRDLCFFMNDAGSDVNRSNDDSDVGEVAVVAGPADRYRPGTREILKTVRKSVWVEQSRIHSYLSTTLRGQTSPSQTENWILLIQKHHAELCFENAVDETEERRRDEIQLSVPPGIENLGATCYLNTQLQCLAQNTVFLNGIFSWEPPQRTEKYDKMTSILEKFQSLLASMHGGARSTTGTLEFSNALGLDHYEQQDPNEFSKLFFDKLHQNFQQQGQKEGRVQCDLADLLPLLFEGVIRYETTCLKCRTVSTRKEKFMDQNLPIAKPNEKNEKRQLNLIHMFSEKRDVDVQYCWNQSYLEETFDGDNQYFCSVCNSKQDAKRCPKFEKLPPVLNVQLSRYQFDIASLSKKKLTDKVLLSRELMVTSEEERNGSSEEKSYVLCAVMKHLGKSAYSGHYIAEAMDWVTGEWFEFNDEEVKWLQVGPSNSDSEVRIPGAKGKRGRVEGSQDAYNMYYVEEGFLAQSIRDFFQRRLQPKDRPSVLLDTTKARTDEYARLQQSCLDDIQIHQRLVRRRKLICEKVWPPNHWKTAQSAAQEKRVWIDGDFLRKFVSCDEPFDAELKSGAFLSKVISPDLSPRLARRGKFITDSTFRAILEIWKAEQRMCMCGPFEDIHPASVAFSSSQEEQKDYIRCLLTKLHRVRAILQLYDNLEPAKLHQDSVSRGDKVYVVAKTFVSSFHSTVESFMKKVKSADVGVDKSLAAAEAESPCEGLDSIDATGLFNFQQQRGPDPLVNSKITCIHGNLSKSTGKRSVHFVSESCWQDLQVVFPEAIPVPGCLGEKQPHCQLCESDDLAADALSVLLAHLSKQCLESQSYRQLECSTILKNDRQEKYHLVHLDNLEAIRKFSNYFKRPKKASAEKYAEKIAEHMLSEFDIDDRTAVGGKFLDHFFIPLVCREHGLPLHDAICTPKHMRTSRVEGLLDERVAVVAETDYKRLLLEVAAIGVVYEKCDANSSHDSCIDGVMKKAETLRDGYLSGNPDHPTVVAGCWIPQHTGGKPPVVLYRPMEKLCALFSVELETCKHPSCRDILQKQKQLRKKDPPTSCNEVIDLVEYSSSSFQLSVVEVEEDTSNELVLHCLTQCLGVPLSSSSDQFVRRSTRRRRPRIKNGVYKSEETVRCELSNNLASLRLLLIESVASFSPHHELKLVVLPRHDISESAVVDVDAPETLSVEPIIVKLPFTLNEKSLLEIFTKEFSFSKFKTGEFEGRVYLVRSETIDPSSVEISKEAILDHLMGLSDAISPVNKTAKGKHKSQTREKGFTGTFLSDLPDRSGESGSNPTRDDDPSSMIQPIKSAMKSASSVSSQSDKPSYSKRARFSNNVEVGCSNGHAFTSENEAQFTVESDSNPNDSSDSTEEAPVDISDPALPVSVAQDLIKEFPLHVKDEELAYQAACQVVRESTRECKDTTSTLVHKAFSRYSSVKCDDNIAKEA